MRGLAVLFSLELGKRWLALSAMGWLLLGPLGGIGMSQGTPSLGGGSEGGRVRPAPRPPLAPPSQPQKVPHDYDGPVEVMLDRVVAKFDERVDIDALARRMGLKVVHRFQGAERIVILEASSVEAATAAAARLSTHRGVSMSFQDRWVNRTHDSFVPNDPLFQNPSWPESYGGQWHLGNDAAQSFRLPHINVQGAWERGITGAGVTIGIVDDGVDGNHVDIVANFSAENSFDFARRTANQQLIDSDRHGMAVAGLAGAVGGNGEGVSGSAPGASIGGLRVPFGEATFGLTRPQITQAFQDAVVFNSVGDGATIDVKNHSYGINAPYVFDSAAMLLQESAEAGTIHVKSAGNARGRFAEDSNKRMFDASPYAITVAALGSDGMFASYSSFGANVFVTSPSSSFNPGALGLTTTDRMGDSVGYNIEGSNDYSDRNYTSSFGGTSGAAPIVAGVMALGKQVNPDMDVRLAKHALARTSRIVDANDRSMTSDGGWRRNQAGIAFNQNYGFGLIDATAFVDMVQMYEVTPLEVYNSGYVNLRNEEGNGIAIPGNDPDGIAESVFSPHRGPLEEVRVLLDVTHSWVGDVQATLISPSGYSSRLMMANIFESNAPGAEGFFWTFTTNAFWGEDAFGQWTVVVADMFEQDEGTWDGFAVEWRIGTIVPIGGGRGLGGMRAVPEPSALALVGLFAVAGAGWQWRRRRQSSVS